MTLQDPCSVVWWMLGPNAGWGEWLVDWMITRIPQPGKGSADFQMLHWWLLRAGRNYSVGTQYPGFPRPTWLQVCAKQQLRHGGVSTRGVAAWSDGHGSESVPQLLSTSSGKETKKHHCVGSQREQTHKVMCMQVVRVYQIINKHPINVTEYICSFSKLSECLTAVLTKLYYCSSCIEVQGCFVVYIYRHFFHFVMFQYTHTSL